MKRQILFLHVLALMVCLSCALGVNAYDFESGGIYYSIVEDKTVMVTYKDNNYNSYSGDVTIPATVTYGGVTYTVTIVGYAAFYNCNNMTSVSLPETVLMIDQWAFASCTNLSVFVIPDAVNELRAHAFYGCVGLKSMVIPDQVIAVGAQCFENCSGMTSLVIGKSVSLIRSRAFYCSNLTSVTILAPYPPLCLDGNPFSVSSSCVLYTPLDVQPLYMDNWGGYFSHFQSITSLDVALNVTGGKLSFSTNGQYLWKAVGAGLQAYAQSGNAGVPGSTSTMSTTVSVENGGELSFDFKAWGEGSSYDKCVFSVDGNPQFTFGARKNDWESYTVRLAPGTHRLTWSYTKDNSVNPEGDYFAVDNVKLEEFGIMRGDVNADGQVNISDVTVLIDYILSGNAAGVSLGGADADQSGNVNISDVTALIDFILAGNWPPTTYTVGGVTFRMIEVEGGTFTMGATPEQGSWAFDDEKPAHEVSLSSFSIAETEVTQALWQAVMGTNPSEFKGDLNRPVEMVSWEDCQAFLNKLYEMTGTLFRLPTEAEWEYAARGGNKSKGYIFSGSNTDFNVAWYSTNSGSTTHPVGLLVPNELGLYDMSGNVNEWCSDWYAEDFYSISPSVRPVGPDSGTRRVFRGGSWTGSSNYCRVSYRFGAVPAQTRNYLGLRLAL